MQLNEIRKCYKKVWDKKFLTKLSRYIKKISSQEDYEKVNVYVYKRVTPCTLNARFLRDYCKKHECTKFQINISWDYYVKSCLRYYIDFLYYFNTLYIRKNTYFKLPYILFVVKSYRETQVLFLLVNLTPCM